MKKKDFVYLNNVETETEYHIKGFSDYRNMTVINLTEEMFNSLKNLKNEIVWKGINLGFA